ncbi:hypothetical protein AB835_00600 [Candidatus Endobugula sertula]|uniref:HTH cro/C1-type domain-containing protein n=1 Tax=Candidatus Endobugula sertula TaxID=62101 RepID=A0A1D2QTZ9_9GAMM|nr:hypothetical protein AB835_00600 [Candidatus Endobugula sertula]
MADIIGIHANSLKKYEAGQAQPSIDVLKKIALELHINTDCLLFGAHERGPSENLALQLKAVTQMSEDEQMVIREVLGSFIIKYQPFTQYPECLIDLQQPTIKQNIEGDHNQAVIINGNNTGVINLNDNSTGPDQV